MYRCLLCLALLAVVGGCGRSWYRQDADREIYTIEAERVDEWLWPVGRTNITAPPVSRLFDPFNPDFPPLPPDDPAANFLMMNPDGQRATRTYHRDGDARWIEDPAWRAFLTLDKEGNLELEPERAVELGLLNSREYQRAMEDLYKVALTLSLDRFEFALHWFGLNETTYRHFGAGPTDLNTLTTTTNIGFDRKLAAGGQLLVDFANSFVFSYSGVNKSDVTSNIGVALIQPLLRNAGRRVRLETLTQAERNCLYAVRDFARFRKQFYVDLATSSTGYLGLLAQVQNIRNLESNLKSLEATLRLHEALFARGTVSTVQVDQAFQSYQLGQLALVQARATLETSLDTYKRRLGLPPALPVKLDDSLLDPFQLASPALEKLQENLDRFFAEYREMEQAPPVESLKVGYDQLRVFHGQLSQLTKEVEVELDRWAKQSNTSSEDPAQLKREQATRTALERQMPEIRSELEKLTKDLAKEQAGIAAATRVKDWENLQKRARQLIAGAARLYVVQSQVRVYLINLEPIPYTLDEAQEYAWANRLDLMNKRAHVVDAWRKIEVAANTLKAGLDLKVTADVATRLDGDNPFDFRASASQYTVGLALDSPLNRMAERNLYRTSLIAYQQSRRDFMALEDQIQAAVRLDIRQLLTERANFNIARQSLIAAARQLEAARDRLLILPNAADTTGTQDVLNALRDLLLAKSTLISSWINYQSGRAQLLLDMEALRLDSRGLPDEEPINNPASVRLGTPFALPDQLPAPRVLPDGKLGGN